MIKVFKRCWTSYNRVYLSDSTGTTFTINMDALTEILNNTDLKATKKRANYSLEKK